ncbi:MAG: transport permease protein [Anaerolineaceae bacterium]|nr:ABC transporter permease [Chloroflexota bacterium]NOG76534.1 ABC transporter permease [Chloroflexota bacterium]WKZ54295.1 MAG: ABC transporter permease [Anaerolineales bacterium]GIK10714.1 MAG: transport permease protein [Chloroflexota bacterium]GJQ38062.1 MAG: transport permease protein [Anaerolineaceae bacterium]
MTEITKHEPATIYIKPSHGLAALNLRDLWVYRELVFFMVWRDVKVKYKQTLLGMAWAVIQPVMTMLVFTFLFGTVAKLPTDGIPYPVFSFTALLPWGLFVTALNQGSRSLVAHNNMVTKIYFPRLILPMSAVFAGLVDFAIAFVILVALMVYYHVTPAWNLVWTLPLFLLLALVAALGVALWLSAINVKYRDVNQALPFLTQFWLFATPVAYSSSVISPKWQIVYSLNPMAGVVNGFRWALLGSGNGPDVALWVSAAISILVLVTGLFYFRSTEKTFADTI